MQFVVFFLVVLVSLIVNMRRLRGVENGQSQRQGGGMLHGTCSSEAG